MTGATASEMKVFEKSFWGDLYSSFPLLAAELAGRDLIGWEACVLGASDGKFVVPLAGGGVQVTAVDVDPVMLYGGDVPRPGRTDHIAGLVRNLADEGLTDRCVIIEADYMDWEPGRAFDIVMTSGSWPYNRNLKHGLAGVVCRMQRLTGPGGYVFADYLLPYTDAELANELYPQPDDLDRLFPADEWRSVHNHDVGLVSESHYGAEEWHSHRYGALLMQRL
jgi:hypothetical protein